MNQTRRINPLQGILIGGGISLFLLILLARPSAVPEVDIGQVLQMAEEGQVETIQVRGDELNVTTTSGDTLTSRKESGVSILELLEGRGIATGEEGIRIQVEQESESFLGTLLPFLPLVIIGGLFFYMLRRARTGMSQAMGLGQSKARVVLDDRPSVTFNDVAGAEEAKQELAEIVEFLSYPEKFALLGAKIPRGVLLTGPPGTGKTLVSKAVAGEAGAPFFSISGSQFVEMFVGVGANRVRDLFNRARKSAPSIIFIDEIDAVGRHRGAGIGGGNDEREQTLNQILVEMDGFDERTNVIVIAATNRPDVLDLALLRPGRFDRRITLDLPDVKEREAILRVHVRGKPLLPDVDLHTLAKQTHGFSGADLESLTNEAAILAARQNKSAISFGDLEEAIDRVIAGPAKRSRQISEKERGIVAHHEAGHALVAAQVPHADPVQRVTIVARGAAGGYTRLLPDEDRSLWSKGQFEAMLAVTMGGQAAEEVVFGDITTGASNDLKNASVIARKMVTEYGMSEELGPRSFDTGQELIFLSKELAQGHNYSDTIAEKIDTEIGSFLHKAQRTAKRIIESNRSRLALLAHRLLAEETVEGAELQELLATLVEEAPLAA